MILECKQCGGEVPCEEKKQVATCSYCGSLNTIAKSIEAQGGLVNRANYLRRNNEFDKALAVYEDILKQDNTDYEAHWGLVLCRYGIEYVEDPATHQKIPTCHRTLNESIYTDLSYKTALEYAPLDVREVYEREAAQIDGIQKNIIALSQREEKYDVFICYKEADEAGDRTPDSVIAQELEFELSKHGYKVFFARKTLEGKLGSAFEPVIFAALQSAKAMVVLGTKPEHFNSVWVKNEWSRYRELIRKGTQKTLIPAYRDMSPYDLPQEFSNLQALDMGKLGFVQDLCDGIDRLTRTAKRTAAAQTAETLGTAAPGAEALLKRAFLFIEEGDFTNADAYLERALDASPEEGRAYIGKLMVERRVREESQLAKSTQPLEMSAHYTKAMLFTDASTMERLVEYNRSTVENAQRAEVIRHAEEERRSWIKSMEIRMVNECERRLPSEAGFIILGILLFIGAFILIIPEFVKAVDSAEISDIFGMLLLVMLYSIPGSIFIALGYSRKQRKKLFMKYRDSLCSGVRLAQLAQAAGMMEKYIAKELNIIIKRKYLQNAYFNNDTLYFQFGSAADPNPQASPYPAAGARQNVKW